MTRTNFKTNSCVQLGSYAILVIYGKGVWKVQIFLSPLYNFKEC